MTTAPVPARRMDEPEARRLTSQIRLIAGAIHSQLDTLKTLIDQAAEGNVHEVLGFPSWTAYLSDVLGSQDLRLDTAERRDLVGYLSGSGMSTRAIAGSVGASKTTITADLQVVSIGTPAAAPDHFRGAAKMVPSFGINPSEPRFALTEDEHERALALARGAGDLSVDGVNAAAERVLIDKPITRPTTAGLDGKTYPRRTQPARRPDITKVAFRAGMDVRRVAARVEKIGNDPRLSRNQESLARELVGQLRYAIGVYQSVLDRLAPPTLEDKPGLGNTSYEVLPPTVSEAATARIQVGPNTAVVMSGWPTVRAALEQLGIRAMRDHADTKLMCFPARLADDVQAALELRKISCTLYRTGDA